MAEPSPPPTPPPAPRRRRPAQWLPFALVSLLTVAFMFWAMRRCSAGAPDYAVIEEQQTREDYLERRDSVLRDSIRRLQAELGMSQAGLSAAEEEASARRAALLRARQPLPGDSARGAAVASAIIRETTLYSTINGLNVRVQPRLGATVIARLGLYDSVAFLNEVTDSLHTIDLGDIEPTAPWVKIRLPDGRSGWVYGPGMSYYKYRLEGVIN